MLTNGRVLVAVIFSTIFIATPGHSFDGAATTTHLFPVEATAAEQPSDEALDLSIRFPTDDLSKSPLQGLARERAASQISPGVANQGPNEQSERIMIGEEAKNLLNRRKPRDNFDKIEALLSRYRSEKERTQSGVWKLGIAYSKLASGYSWHLMTPENWANAKIEVLNWSKQYPNSPSPHIYWARQLANQALAALQAGRGPQVLPNAEAIRLKLAEAQAYLEEHKAVASADPYWYGLMIDIMSAQKEPIEKILQVLDEGSDREPLYSATYFAAAHAIAYGSRDFATHVEALANTAVEKTQKIEGSQEYARIYWVVFQSIIGLDKLQQTKIDWKKMTQSMEEVADAYPVQWNIQHFALFSCFAGDHETARKYLGKIKGRPDQEIWGGVEAHQFCEQLASAEAQTPSKESRKVGGQ